jgi:hypothetical protein
VAGTPSVTRLCTNFRRLPGHISLPVRDPHPSLLPRAAGSPRPSPGSPSVYPGACSSRRGRGLRGIARAGCISAPCPLERRALSAENPCPCARAPGWSLHLTPWHQAQGKQEPVRSEALPRTGPRPSEAGTRWYPAGRASLPGPLQEVSARSLASLPHTRKAPRRRRMLGRPRSLVKNDRKGVRPARACARRQNPRKNHLRKRTPKRE